MSFFLTTKSLDIEFAATGCAAPALVIPVFSFVDRVLQKAIYNPYFSVALHLSSSQNPQLTNPPGNFYYSLQ